MENTKEKNSVGTQSTVCLVLGVVSFVLSAIVLFLRAFEADLGLAVYIILAAVAIALGVVCHVIFSKIKDMGAKMSFITNGSNFSNVAFLMSAIIIIVSITVR